MISEALELFVNGGQVTHSWCMCIASRGYGGGMDVGGGWCACWTKAGDWSHFGSDFG